MRPPSLHLVTTPTSRRPEIEGNLQLAKEKLRVLINMVFAGKSSRMRVRISNMAIAMVIVTVIVMIRVMAMAMVMVMARVRVRNNVQLRNNVRVRNRLGLCCSKSNINVEKNGCRNCK